MKSTLLHLSYSLENIDSAAVKFWETLGRYRIFAFSGDMGAGKTTFIHKLCDFVHVEDVVSSPTFALINEYHFVDAEQQDQMIYHMDWYRLKDSAEAVNTGMEDCIRQGRSGEAYCFIEWPERAKELLQPPYLWISIEPKSRTERTLTAVLIA